MFKGVVDYKVDVCGKNSSECHITLLDADRMSVAESRTCSGQLIIPTAILWWPFMSGKSHIAYLYTFQVPIIVQHKLRDFYYYLKLLIIVQSVLLT